MKIKTKLAISFCIIIFVPVVLTSIVLVGFNKIQLKAINKTYGMEDAGMLALTDTVQFLNKVTGRTYDELEKTSLIEPSKLKVQITILDIFSGNTQPLYRCDDTPVYPHYKHGSRSKKYKYKRKCSLYQNSPDLRDHARG